MSVKVLKFVSGVPKELSPNTDEIAALSFKFGGDSGTVLTKQLVDTLIGGGDSSLLHNHDTEYYTKQQVDQKDTDGIEAATLYTDEKISEVMGGLSPETLDTIKELADAMLGEQGTTLDFANQITAINSRISDIENDTSTADALDAEIARALAAELLKLDNVVQFVAGESILSGEMVCLKNDQGVMKAYKASSAAADNLDPNDNSLWEAIGCAQNSCNAGETLTAKTGHEITPVFESAPSSSDIGKSVFLSSSGKVSVYTAPSQPSSCIVHLGRMVSSTSFWLTCPQLRGVNGDA